MSDLTLSQAASMAQGLAAQFAALAKIDEILAAAVKAEAQVAEREADIARLDGEIAARQATKVGLNAEIETLQLQAGSVLAAAREEAARIQAGAEQTRDALTAEGQANAAAAVEAVSDTLREQTDELAVVEARKASALADLTATLKQLDDARAALESIKASVKSLVG